jgi:hypothetical protein
VCRWAFLSLPGPDHAYQQIGEEGEVSRSDAEVGAGRVGQRDQGGIEPAVGHGGCGHRRLLANVNTAVIEGADRVQPGFDSAGRIPGVEETRPVAAAESRTLAQG